MVYRTTLTPLVTLRREVDKLFDETFGRGSAVSAWHPAVDVREEDGAFVFEVELPGIDPANVEVTADQGVLTVRGEKRSRDEQGANRWHLIERTAGRFVRTFALPTTVNEEQIDASFANGLLTIRAAKAEVPKPRRIDVAVR